MTTTFFARARRRLAAVVRGSIPYVGGPWDGLDAPVSRMDTLIGANVADAFFVLRLADGTLETHAVKGRGFNPLDPRFDEGMVWLGTYAQEDCGTLEVLWQPYADRSAAARSSLGEER